MPVCLLVRVFGVQGKEGKEMMFDEMIFSLALLVGFLIVVAAIAVIIRATINSNTGPESVTIGRTVVTSCKECKLHRDKDNPVMPVMPIVMCLETAKIVYNPSKIPWWCPYANK